MEFIRKILQGGVGVKRVFLFTTYSGSEYLVVLTPARDIPAFTVLLLAQFKGGNEWLEGGLTYDLPEIGQSFVAAFKPEGIRTSMVTNVREIP